MKPPLVAQIKSALTIETDPACVKALDLAPTGSALVFNNPALLREAFPLDATLRQLVATSDSAGTAEAMLSTALNTYRSTEETNLLSELTIPVDA